MALTKQKTENRLLAHHLFPRIAKRGDQLPPCFVSTGLKLPIASQLINLNPTRPNGYGGMVVQTTRYNLAPRSMEILHPRAYCKIVRELKTSWDEWKFIETNRSSALRLTDHADKRVFSMIANSSVDELMTPGSRFIAKIDITSFYDSIYTHAIPWAVYGVQQAKLVQNNVSDWTNRLDAVVRLARRKETTGISIGPGTSAIIGEIMLGSIDQRLQGKGYEFKRFLDDYFFTSDTRDRAENFVRDVRDELSALKLAIHPGKTEVSELPTPLFPSWMRNLRQISRSGKNHIGKLLDILDEVIESPHRNNEEGPLRYALVSIESAITETAINADQKLEMADRLLTLGFLRTIAVPYACRILDTLGSQAVLDRSESLNRIIREHVANKRTDATTWSIYLLLKHKAPLEQATVTAIIESGEALSVALLTSDGHYIQDAWGFIESFESRNPEDYMRDEYWLVYYQLFLRGYASQAALDDGYLAEFEPLKDDNISFIDLNATNPYLPTHTRKKRTASYGTGGGGGSDPYA